MALKNLLTVLINLIIKYKQVEKERQINPKEALRNQA